jgi:hypothetical protein
MGATTAKAGGPNWYRFRERGLWHFSLNAKEGEFSRCLCGQTYKVGSCLEARESPIREVCYPCLFRLEKGLDNMVKPSGEE